MSKKKAYNLIIDLLVFLQIFIFAFSIILSKEISNLDEIWNYNTARQIMLGNLPYKNLSMITTPLLPFIVSIFLKLFGDELLTFRIISAFILTILFFMMYKIIFNVTKNKVYSIISTSLIMIIFKGNFALDYNIFAVLINLLILYIELSFKDTKPKRKIFNYNFCIGLLAGLAFLTKQTIGCFIILEVCLIQFICAENDKELKANARKYFRNLLIRILGIFITIFIFALYLIISNSLSDFIDYAVLGLKTFSNKIPYRSLFENNKLIIKILSVILPIFFVEELIRKIVLAIIFNKKEQSNSTIASSINNVQQNNLNVNSKNDSEEIFKNNIGHKSNLDYVFYYSIFMIIIEYPITDENHFLIANLFLLMYGLIMIFNLKYIENFKMLTESNIESYIKNSNENNDYSNTQRKNLNEKNSSKIKSNKVEKLNTLLNVFYSIMLAITICVLNVMSYNNFKTYQKFNVSKNVNHYKNLYVSQYLIDRINSIDDVIKNNQNKTIYIVDAEAYKNYDMFLNGNIGKDGADGIIEDIKNSKDSIYIIKKDGMNLNWQTPTEVLDYIRNNLKYVGSTSIFDIYEKD